MPLWAMAVTLVRTMMIRVTMMRVTTMGANVVTMAAMKELAIPHEKTNVHGGAVSLGHPIGASGARTLVTLVNALRKRGGKIGIDTLCIGGGEAVALAVERI